MLSLVLTAAVSLTLPSRMSASGAPPCRAASPLRRGALDRVRGGADAASIEIISRTAVAGGELIRFSHASTSTKTTMTAAIFVPPGVEYAAEIPTLYWLSGLTCTDENFCQKSGAFLHAAYAEQYRNRTYDIFSLYSLFTVACSTPRQES